MANVTTLFQTTISSRSKTRIVWNLQHTVPSLRRRILATVCKSVSLKLSLQTTAAKFSFINFVFSLSSFSLLYVVDKCMTCMQCETDWFFIVKVAQKSLTSTSTVKKSLIEVSVRIRYDTYENFNNVITSFEKKLTFK